MKAELSPDTIQLFYHLWRGGGYSYYSDKNRCQLWFEADSISAPNPPSVADIWYGVNPVYQIPPTNSKGEKRPLEFIRAQNNYIGHVNCLFGDFDSKDFGSMADTLVHVESLKIEPSVIINSGGGYHCYWILENSITVDDGNRENVKQSQWNWVEYVKADIGVKDLTRVLRVPGTLNKKPKYGDGGRMVEFIKTDFELQYDHGVLSSLSEPEKKQEKPIIRPVMDYIAGNDEIENERNRVINRVMMMVHEAPSGQKHTTLLKASRLMGGYVAGGYLNYLVAESVLRQSIEAREDVNSLKAAYTTIERGLAHGQLSPITPQQKEAERRYYKNKSLPINPAAATEPVTLDAFYWTNQYKVWF